MNNTQYIKVMLEIANQEYNGRIDKLLISDKLHRLNNLY